MSGIFASGSYFFGARSGVSVRAVGLRRVRSEEYQWQRVESYI